MDTFTITNIKSEWNDVPDDDANFEDSFLPDDENLQGADDDEDDIRCGRSKDRYWKAYNAFVNWQKSQPTSSFAECDDLMAYFNEKSQLCKPSTLWAMYSMLRSTLLSKHQIDISKQSKLIEFLKQKNDGFIGKKTKVFKPEEIQKFILEAPDDRYLIMKVGVYFA